MKFDFQLKPRTGVGFVAGASGCQVAVATATDVAPRVIVKPAPPRPAGTDPQAPVSPPKASEWLTQLRPQLGKHRFRLATAVDSSEVFCKRITLPAANAAEVRQMLSLQIDKWSPLPMEEVVWSYEILGTEAGNSDVLVVFGKKDKLISRAEDFGDEFTPDLIDVDLLVLWRALRKTNLFQGKKHGLLLWSDLRGKSMKCLLLNGPMPVFVEHLPFEEATAVLLAHELSVLLLGAEANFDVRQLDAIFVVGADEASTTLGQQVAVELGVPVTTVKMTDDLSGATGLARRALQNGEAQVNLLPLDFVQRQQKKQFRRQAWRVGFVVLAAYLLALILFTGVIAWRKHSIRRMDAEMDKSRVDFDKARLLQAQVRFLDQKLDDRKSALEMLRVVTEAMTDQLYLMNFVYKQQQTLELRGVAQSAPEVYTFIDKLQKSGLFAAVKPGNIRSTGRGSEVSLDVTCTMTGASVPPTAAPPSRNAP